MKNGQVTNFLIVNHVSGTVDRQYLNGRVYRDIGSHSGKGARQICFGGKVILLHRFIYLDFHGPIAPWMQIDHIHGKSAGNGIGNLRWTTSAGNSRNQRKAHKDGSSGLLGVNHAKNCGQNPWRAKITVNGRQKNLGNYKTPEDAHRAYIAAKRSMHETCTI
jgi:hypothetical protein